MFARAGNAAAGPTMRPMSDRRALGGVAAQFFVNGVVVASFLPRLPEIRDRAGITTSELGIVLAVAGLAGLGSSAVVGRVVETLGTRRVIMLGSVGLVGALPIIGFARHPIVLLAGLMLVTASDLFVDVAMNLQASWLSARRSTPVMHRLHGLWSIGTVAGGVTSARVAAGDVGVASHLAVSAVVVAAVLAFTTHLVLRDDEHPADAVAAEHRALRGLWLLGLVGLFAFTAEIVPGDWAAVRLADDLGASAGLAGLGYVAFTSGMTVGRLAGDWVQALLGAERLLRLSPIVAAVGVAVAGLADDAAVSIVFYGVTGVGVAPLFPGLYDAAAQRPGQRGAGLGALTAGTRIGGLVAPAAIGALSATALSVGGAVALLTIVALGGIWVRAWVPNRPRVSVGVD